MQDIKQARPSPFEDLKSRFKFSGFKFGGSKKLSFLIGLVVILMIAYNLFFVYVEPNEFGIKVVRIGMNRGVQKDVYPSGLNFILPLGFQQIHRLPKDVQGLELTNYPKTAAKFARQEKAAHIQTSDGFFVDVDVSILYRPLYVVLGVVYAVSSIIGGFQNAKSLPPLGRERFMRTTVSYPKPSRRSRPPWVN